MKTFLGWCDEQLPDGTVPWTAPNGTCITRPAGKMLFPGWNSATVELPTANPPPDSGGAEA
jgi:hypothetical protein